MRLRWAAAGMLAAQAQFRRVKGEDRDELLAERPRTLLVDIALQAEQAPLGYLSCGDFVHDGPLSAQSVDEVVGELPAGVVYELDLPPVRRYPLCSVNRIACEQFPDRGKRQVELAQHRDEARCFELRDVVVPIARGSVDTGGNQYAKLVVEAECLDRQTRPSCELANADFFHVSHFLVVEPPPDTSSVRSPRGGESSSPADSVQPGRSPACRPRSPAPEALPPGGNVA